MNQSPLNLNEYEVWVLSEIYIWDHIIQMQVIEEIITLITYKWFPLEYDKLLYISRQIDNIKKLNKYGRILLHNSETILSYYNELDFKRIAKHHSISLRSFLLLHKKRLFFRVRRVIHNITSELWVEESIEQLKKLIYEVQPYISLEILDIINQYIDDQEKLFQ